MSPEQQEQAFLQAIREHPDDDTPRLVYADWLDERAGGGSARAELIRVQCRLASQKTSNRRKLKQRETELLDMHYEEWSQPFTALGARDIAFSRGFPVALSMNSSDFLKNATQLFALAPIRELHIALSQPDDIIAVAASTHLSQLTTLNLNNNHIHPEGAMALADSPNLRNLTRLDLRDNWIGAEGVHALANSPNLCNLTQLDLGGNFIGNAVAQSLAVSPYLHKLTKLSLERNHINSIGVQALAASPIISNFTKLDLQQNNIITAGAQALATSPHLTKLTELDVHDNSICDAGAVALAYSPFLKLTLLNLSSNHIDSSLLHSINNRISALSRIGRGHA